MKYRFVALHTMNRGAGKPAYVVNCARLLAETNARVVVLDGLMYEQGAIPHTFFQLIGAAPVLENGKNLYDLIRDYETLCAGSPFPAAKCSAATRKRLRYPGTADYRGSLLPEVRGRATPLPGQDAISYLPGNNGDVVEVRERIDFHDLFEHHSGRELFAFVKQELTKDYDVVLLNAPAGHQEISGIICGQMADLILAIDVDSPATDSNPSYEACGQLAQKVRDTEQRTIEVKSVRGHPPEEVVQMILES